MPATAQQTDPDLALPEAKPGECYAKVITPATFETRNEEVVIQEASEEIETVEAQYETISETFTIHDAYDTLEVTPAAFTTVTEQVEIRAAENNWTTQGTSGLMPANSAAIEQIAAAGVDLEAVEPGGCFVEYYSEAQYEIEEVQVMTKAASESIEIIPAVTETVEQEVEIKEASSEVVDVPAIYRTVTESVMVEPARSAWQEDCGGAVEQVANATGEVMCLVEVPARFETLTKTVLDKPATTKTVDIPAEFRTLEVQKLASPATEKRTEIPAEYRTVEKRVKVAEPTFFWLAKGEAPQEGAIATGREICLTENPAETMDVEQQIVSEPASVSATEVPAVQESVEILRLVSPASETRSLIPERTTTVPLQVQIEESRVEWKQVLCKVNMTREIITSLQQALKREGYDPGPADGFVGRGTLRAMEQYQAEEGLDRGGITLELLKRLNVES